MAVTARASRRYSRVPMSNFLKSRGAVRVLVVDDYRPLADAFTGMLSGYGYEARAAYSSAEALLMSAELEPHALIADAIMPGMDGFQLAALVKTRFPGCSVLLASAGYGKAAAKGGRPFKLVDKGALMKEAFLMLERCRL